VAAAADHSTQQGIVVTLDQLRNGGPPCLVQTGAHSAAQNGLDALLASGVSLAFFALSNNKVIK